MYHMETQTFPLFTDIYLTIKGKDDVERKHSFSWQPLWQNSPQAGVSDADSWTCQEASYCLNSINSSQTSQDGDPDFCYVKYGSCARIIELWL